MNRFCPSCEAVQEVETSSREETYPIRGEEHTIKSEVSICTVCGEEFSTAEQAQSSLVALREAYRRKHNLVTPEEIVAIREGYGAGQKPFGKILGLGEATINNYEQGELPTTAHSNLIRTASDPLVFTKLFEEAGDLIGPTQRKRIGAHLSETQLHVLDLSRGIIVREEPDEYTGFRSPDPRRIEALLGLIVKRIGGAVYKTKALKLAFLSEYEHFRRHTVTITGWPYARLDHGPIPQEYKQLLVNAEKDGFLLSEDHDEGTTTLSPGPKALDIDERELFSPEELETLETVIERWGEKSATELSSYTHTLPAWKETPHAKEIPFSLALAEGE